MPNYVTNIIKFKSPKKSIISRLFRDILNDNNEFDFGIFLIPSDWDTKWNACGTEVIFPDYDVIFGNSKPSRYYREPRNKIFNKIKLTELQKHLKMEKGFYFFEITFETAWNYPELVINKLSSLYPEVEIDIMYADENVGSNCGSYTIKNNKETKIEIAPLYAKQTSNKIRYKWVKKACDIKGVNPVYYGYNEQGVYSDAIAEEPEKYLKLSNNIKEF